MAKLNKFELTKEDRESLQKLDGSIDKLIAKQDENLINGKTQHDVLRLQEKNEAFRVSIDSITVSDESTGTGILFVSTLRKGKSDNLKRNTAVKIASSLSDTENIKPFLKTPIEETNKVRKTVVRTAIGKTVARKNKQLNIKMNMVAVDDKFKSLSQEERMKSVTTLHSVVSRMEDLVEEDLVENDKSAYSADISNSKTIVSLGIKKDGGEKHISTMIVKMLDRNENETLDYINGLLE